MHTATGDAGVDEAVVRAAQERRTWCVRASDGSRSSAWTPSVVRREDVVVSVTAGRDPRRAAAISGALATHPDTGGAPLRRRRPGPGRVVVVGGGPGSPDLLTLRGRRALAEADVVVTDAEHPQRRVVLASCLLAPGVFSGRLAEAGADAVADPLSADPRLARIALRRYDEALAQGVAQEVTQGAAPGAPREAPGPAGS